MDINDINNRFSDDELQLQISGANKKSKSMLIMSLILFGIFALITMPIVIMIDDGVISPVQFGIIVGSAIILLIPGVLLFIQYSKSKAGIEGLLSSNIIQGVLEEAFDVYEYNPRAYIGKETIKESGLIKGWDRCSGSALIRGKFKGHPFTFSNIHLESVILEDDSDGEGTHEKVETIFQGSWIILEHDIDVKVSLMLREKTPSIIGRSDIQTESIAFNNRFQIQTEDSHTAYLILTPHFMEKITSADSKANGNTFIYFSGKHLSMGIHNSRSCYGANLNKQNDLNVLRTHLRADNEYLTGVMDELMQNDYLFD